MGKRAYNSRGYRRARRLILSTNPRCALRLVCDGDPATTTDHIIPVSMGGSNAVSNLRPACMRCNSARGNRVITRTSLPW